MRFRNIDPAIVEEAKLRLTGAKSAQTCPPDARPTIVPVQLSVYCNFDLAGHGVLSPDY